MAATCRWGLVGFYSGIPNDLSDYQRRQQLLGAVVDGVGVSTTVFDTNGTPIRADVGNDRIKRHNDKIRQSEAPLNLANNRVLVPWEFDDNQFGVTNPSPSTASQAAVAAANDRVVVARQWAVLLELLTPGSIDMDPIDAECYSEGLGAMACMWDWGRAPSALGATDFAIAMLAPVLISQLPVMAGWAAGQVVTLGEAAAAACATRCPAITRWIANAGEETAECTMSLSNGIGWEDSIDCTLALIGSRAAIKGGGGTPPPGETSGSTNDARFIYRTGSQTDGSLSDPTGVSFRDSVSSAADRSQTFGPRDKVFAVDTGLLSPDSVAFDGGLGGRPDGHVSVYGTPHEIRGAIVSDFPDNPLEMLRMLEDGSFRIPKK